MAAYKFSLEKVLEWRENSEKAIAKEFVILQGELKDQETTLHNLRQEAEDIKIKILTLKNIVELKRQYLFRLRAEEKIEEQLELIEQTKIKIEQVRLELLEAQKNRKIMEKLKEKDYSKFMKKLSFEEQKHLDEMAVLRYEPM